MSTFEESLPADTAKAVESGVAVIKIKFGNYCVIDAEDESLFDILPLIWIRSGFALYIRREGKHPIITHFAEIIKRQLGDIINVNGFRNDLRKENLSIRED